MAYHGIELVIFRISLILYQCGISGESVMRLNNWV